MKYNIIINRTVRSRVMEFLLRSSSRSVAISLARAGLYYTIEEWFPLYGIELTDEEECVLRLSYSEDQLELIES